MKKLFALVLAVLMICAMSVSVFAANTEHLVGHNANDGTTNTGSYTDGLAENEAFPESASKGYNVDITATVGQVQHRYAVDITYDEMSFSVAGSNLEWNVNTLKYETVDDNALPENQLFNVTVTNYSDLGVNLKVSVIDVVADDGATVAAYENGNDTILTNDNILIDSAIGGVAKTSEFDVKVTSTDWSAVTNYYAKYFSENPAQTSAKMGTMTITIAKVPSSGT